MNYQLMCTFLLLIVVGYSMLMADIRNLFLNAIFVIFFIGGFVGLIASILCIIWL